MSLAQLPVPSPPSEDINGGHMYHFPPQESPLGLIHGAEKEHFRKNSSRAIALLISILLSAVAICFVVLAGLAIRMKGHPVGDSKGNKIEEVMRLGPTIYPVIFAALVSRSLKNIGRFFAEREVRLKTLWALMNTNSLSDPVSHILTVRGSFFVWFLLPLWALSPLGGQGSLRLMHHVNSTTTEIQQLRYLDTGPLGNAFTYFSTDILYDGGGPQSIRDVYIGSLMQRRHIKAGPLDQWGNIKIPRIDALDSSTSEDSNGWLSMEGTGEIESYSSLLGVPIVGLQEMQGQGDLHFTLETTYIELSCPSVNTVQFQNNSVRSFTLTCPGCYQNPNTTGFHFVRCNKFLDSPFPLRPHTISHPLSDPRYSEPQHVLFRSLTTGGNSVATCTVVQRTVESMVLCEDSACSVTKVRPSRTDHRSANVTSFDYWATRVLDMITNTNTPPERTTTASGTLGVGSSELFMCDPSKAPVQGLQFGQGDCVDNWGNANLSQLDPGRFAARASILLNTGIQALMAPTALVGDLPTNNMTLYGPPHLPAEGLHAVINESTLAQSDPFSILEDIQRLTDLNPPFLGAATNATLVRYTEVYQPNYVWAVLLTVSAALLACLGIVGACLDCFTIVPNIFDPVMSLTFTNPYMPACFRRGPLDAVDRLKSVSNQTVQIGKVEESGMATGIAFGEIGHVAPLT